MRIIDADGHVLERDIPWADLIEAPYRSRAPRPVQDNRGFTFVMIDGKLTPKPVGKACSFVGAPRSHRPQPTTGMVDPKQRLKDMDLEGIDTAVLFGTSPFLSLPFVEDKDLGQRRCARLQQLAGRLLQRRSAPAQGGSRGRDSRSGRSRCKSFGALSKSLSSSPSPRRRYRHRKRTSTIPISFPFLPRQNVSTSPYASTSAPATACRRPPSVSIIHFLPTPWRIHSSR